MRKPRILLAAPASGSGKTMITCGILQALHDRELQVASFKCGPDYIDPGYDARAVSPGVEVVPDTISYFSDYAHIMGNKNNCHFQVCM